MKVVQIHNTYLEQGGEDFVVAREGELLENAGHSVDLIMFKNPDEKAGQARDLLLANWNRGSATRTTAALETLSPDVVHVHNTWFAASPSVVGAAQHHAPVVVTLHNYRRYCLNAYLYREGAPCTDCVGAYPWRGVIRRCYHDSTVASVALGVATSVNRRFGVSDRSVDRFLVLSDFAADLLERTGIDRDRIVRHNNFVPDPGPRLVAPSASTTVLAVGRLSPEKGFIELVEEWNRFNPTNLELVIVGDGPERARIESAAGSSIQVVGRRSASEVAELMRSSRALLFPSRWFEGQPLVLLEALAAGLPILSSDHPPLREIVHGADQVLVEDDRWADALEAINDDRWLDNASESARSRWEEHYSPSVAVARLEGIYRSVQR